MSRNTLVINCDLRETRVCLIEDGVIAELHLERSQHRGSVGNIVLGRVTRVLPGMKAAFIDIGLERAAFLHVEDLIRPDDFEAYLAGGKRPEEKATALDEATEAGPEASAEGEAVAASSAPPAVISTEESASASDDSAVPEELEATS